MKKTLALILSALSLTCCACNAPSSTNTSEEESYVELTLENYDYYLSILETLTESGVLMGGSLRYAVYQVTINGAVDGLYENCTLTYKYKNSNETHDVSLNAAGFANFKYTVSNGNTISFVAATGKIYM